MDWWEEWFSNVEFLNSIRNGSDALDTYWGAWQTAYQKLKSSVAAGDFDREMARWGNFTPALDGAMAHRGRRYNWMRSHIDTFSPDAVDWHTLIWKTAQNVLIGATVVLGLALCL